jgi:cytochrome c oxidase cbb3-type subunit 4
MDLSINDVRSLVTLASLLLFLVIAFWAWRPRNQASFRDAAQLVFEDDDQEAREGAAQ